MNTKDLRFHKIVQLNDDRLLPWLDLYETAFPANERILVSYFLHLLKSKPEGSGENQHLLAVMSDQDHLVGMAVYELHPEDAAAVLWYMAVTPETRSKGIGTLIYQEIYRSLDPTTCRSMLFEVEIPEESGPSDASRRITFYRRQGAFLLSGVDYIQHVGWHQPPIPMHIMIHPLRPMNNQDIFPVVKSMFEDHVKQVGEIKLG